MKVFEGLANVGQIKNPVVTIGTFDGVHLGHQKILQQVRLEAEKIEGESVLLTFYPHPRMVLNPENHQLQLIQTQAEKLEKLAECGLENVVIFPFTKAFAQLSALEFVKDILVSKIGAKKIIIGYDHQFGNDRKGNIEFLKNHATEFGYEVIEIPAKEVDEVNVSSTKIRNALLQGDIEMANIFLNQPFEITGMVKKGKQLGRTIGFPTANVKVQESTKLIPINGVYAVRIAIERGENLNAMMNIGTRPTVSNEAQQSIEVNIFDFNEDIYDKLVKVSLFKRIRSEEKFPNLEALKIQIAKDEALIRSYFSATLVS